MLSLSELEGRTPYNIPGAIRVIMSNYMIPYFPADNLDLPT